MYLNQADDVLCIGGGLNFSLRKYAKISLDLVAHLLLLLHFPKD